ncbi:type II toxin-antitoxin system prevent-host-death family antitoxin [Pontiellaceae bacterium B1224]|nr:type II toxin-antitoxin system prevent-host-death family antitoxin [Pontiellaceae bacterium B1224]
MKATVKDLRYNLKNIMESVDRGEEVLITNRGRVKARIVPADASPMETTENPFVGMWSDRDDMEDVDSYVRNLRKGRSL